ncbi:hypothetical protein GT045_11285 [Streptomyces sp. SID486]|uniref:hypothetical protein n=1 Tax=unclassified Streptomyces TaxID=2593676 RepID=UPI0013687E68|nr:hypothetical protein [Streptomyces sp. SID161]MYX95380.1 hypothetical protein [Streptomyces sp. SID486]
MSAPTDRRWAQLARELEFTQLPELRRQAEGWRNGLAGLTALLTVLVTLKGRDDLAELPGTARLAASATLGAAFVLFVTGSVLAVRAAHGHPGERVLLAGQSLRRWTEQEIGRVTRALRFAALCSAAGLLLVAAAVVLAWVTTESPPDHLVRVVTTSGERCGEFLGSGPDGVVLKNAQGGGDERLVLPARTVLTVTAAGSCGPAR